MDIMLQDITELTPNIKDMKNGCNCVIESEKSEIKSAIADYLLDPNDKNELIDKYSIRGLDLKSMNEQEFIALIDDIHNKFYKKDFK